VAILSANYISARLKDHYPTLYASENGHVAHECILDLRPPQGHPAASPPKTWPSG
jgi:glycine dehydrogenase